MTQIALRLQDALSATPGVAAAYLFGSVATGDAGADSDVDIAVLFTAPPPRTLDSGGLPWPGKLESVIGSPVDLIVLNVLRSISAFVSCARAACCSTGIWSARIGFEVRTRNEAFDMEPVLARYRSARLPRS